MLHSLHSVLQEYTRAVAMLKDCETQHGQFMFFYCKYLSGEKSRVDKVRKLEQQSATGIISFKFNVAVSNKLDLKLPKCKLRSELKNVGILVYV